MSNPLDQHHSGNAHSIPPDAMLRFPGVNGNSGDSGLNSKPFATGKPVYPALTEHQKREEEWPLYPVAQRLQDWRVRLDHEFGLQLPQPPLRLVTNLPRNCAGYYLRGHNGLGLENEIAIGLPTLLDSIGRIRVELLDWGELIGTLLHELLHFQQALYGRPGQNNYHNAAYQAMARDCGLVVNSRGYQGYIPRGPFITLLARHGIPLPRITALGGDETLSIPVKPAKKGPAKGSKLKLWMCRCPVRIRVAVLLNAQCLNCGFRFEVKS